MLYCEPGGYYELDAEFTKPVVACVVGRWKSKLTRAVGHAGAMSGGGDDAASKERWFMDKFGVDALFTPERPVCSAKGAVVTNIAAHSGRADRGDGGERRRARLRARRHDGAQALVRLERGARSCRAELDLPVVRARRRPTTSRSTALDAQVGAVFPRAGDEGRLGRFADGRQDAGHAACTACRCSTPRSIRWKRNVGLALLQEPGGENDRKLVSVAIGA